MKNEEAQKLISYMEGISQNRQVLATFKKAWHPESEHLCYKYILGNTSRVLFKEKAFLFIVGAYSILEDTCRKNNSNLGNTLKTLAFKGMSQDTVDTYFNLLGQSSDIDELKSILERVVLVCNSYGVRINLELLLLDMCNWQYYKKEILIQWARSFYS